MTDEEESKQGDAESGASPSDDGEGQTQPREEPEGSAYLDWETGASQIAAQRNAYVGNTIIVDGDFIGSSDGSRSTVMSTTDITSSVKDFESDFVESASFDGVCEALARSRMAVLVGKECGNWFSAGAALRRGGHRPIIELPAGVPAKDLIDSIKGVCREPKAGLLVDSVDLKMLRELEGFELRRLDNIIPSSAALIFTTRFAPQEMGGIDGLPVIEGAPPDAEDVVRAFVRRQGIANDCRDRALEAVLLLSPPVGPGRAVEVAQLAADSDAEAVDLAADVDGRSRVLEEWLNERPEAKGLASLAAAATLEGTPSNDFESAANVLAELLEGETEPSTEPRRFGGANRGWPATVAGFERRQIISHFGWHEAEVVEILLPHRRETVLSFLWRNLGADFRVPFLEWLRTLCTMPARRMINAAASTAGVLFIDDPVTIEREVLRPWALDDRAIAREAAGLALGMPAALGADPNASRLLAQSWSHTSNPRLQEAAIVAYGGPLGAWDPGANGAAHLWQIPRRNPDLVEAANLSLAALFTGGRYAEHARAAVLAVLAAASEARFEQTRVFAVLPSLLERLTAGTFLARESLDGLLSEASSVKQLAALLAEAFDTPTGHQSARESILHLLKAVAAGRIGHETVERLVREMKTAARERGRLPQLGTQLERLLRAEARGHGQLRDVAGSIHDLFYDQRQGGTS